MVTTDASMQVFRSYPQGQDCVGASPSFNPHELPGALGSVPGADVLSALHEGTMYSYALTNMTVVAYHARPYSGEYGRA